MSPPPAPSQPLRPLTIHFPLTQSPEQDTQRLDALMELLARYPGQDPYHLLIQQGDQTLRIDFPQRQVRYCGDLVTELRDLLGPNAITVQRP